MADNTINGTPGDDILQTPDDNLTNEVYGGDGDDFIVDGGVQGNQDTFYGGAGNDNILAGSGNDTIDTGTGDDFATGAEGDDTFLVNDNFGLDSLDGGTFQESSGDVLDATGMTAGATLTFGVDIEIADTSGGPGGGGPGDGSGPGGGGPGDGGDPGDEPDGPTTTIVVGASLEAGPGNTAEIVNVESFILGAGNDTVIDDGGDNTVNMGAGDDEFRITDGFGADTVHGGDGGETIGDLIDGSAITPDVVVTFDGDGTGTFTDGTDTLTFEGIERVATGAGNDSIFGGAGDDSAHGGAGDDIFVMTESGGGDFFRGGEDGETTGDILDGAALTTGVTIVYTGDEATLSDGTSTGGFAEVEHVILGTGDDSITGGTSDESITAGAGNDSFAVLDDFGTDTISLGAGQDTIDGSGLTTDATVDFSAAGDGVLTSGANTVSFTSAETVITGSGNDTINHSATNDSVATGAGDDTYFLADGFGSDDWDAGSGGETTGDVIDATALSGETTATFNDDGTGTLTNGADTLTFESVENLNTGAGNDTITGSNNAETISAGDGDDTVFLSDSFGNDALDGGAAGESTGDRLDGTAMSTGVTVTLTGAESGSISNGSGTLDFSDFEDVVLGSGNDTVAGSTSNDTINTGDGDDSFILTDGFGTDTVDLGSGAESLGDVLDGSALTEDASVNFGANGATLTSGANSATATDAERVITGAGNDTISSGTGNDSISSGAGDDTFLVDDAFGNDTWDAGTGVDTLDATALDAGSTLTLTSGGDGSLTEGTNSVTFTDVENIITGAGNDTITGSAGDDSVATGLGDDTIFLAEDFGTDTIDGGTGGETTGDRIDVSAIASGVTVTFTGNEDGTITTGANTATFTDVENITLGAGNDTVVGSTGDEKVNTGDGDDRFVLADDFGTDTVNLGVGGESTGDTLDGAALTQRVVVNIDGETLTVTQETNTLTAQNVEQVVTGSGDDTVIGDTGDDIIATGAGDDTFVVQGGFGNDTFAGGSGRDSVDASGLNTAVTADFAGSLSSGSDTIAFSEVEILRTGDGDDTITGSDGDETVFSGRGDDTFTVTDGFGDDTFNAGEGGLNNGDLINGDALTGNVRVDFTEDEAGTFSVGNDTLTFTDVERIATGSGDDLILGSDLQDVVFTGDGADRIDGNGGADIVFAGAGNDTISIGAGDDIFAGAGDDVIRVVDTGEASTSTINVDGGAGAGDVLRLGRLADLSTLDTDDDNGSLSGSVELKDGTQLNFQNIENIICFTPGTMILTPHGPRDIARLRVGDMVRTRDNGVQPIRWIQSRTVPAVDRFAPIRLHAGVLPSLTTDLMVSPQHRMLFTGYRAELLFGEREVLIPATHLVNGKDVTQDSGGAVTYIHMMFDAHEIVYANGAPSESFHPGTIGLSAVTEAARQELFTLFPALRSDPNGYGQTARRCLRQHEAQLLSVR